MDAVAVCYAYRYIPGTLCCKCTLHTIHTMWSRHSFQELQRILSRSLDVLYSSITSASGLQTDIDYILVIKTMENQINAWFQTCTDLVQQRNRGTTSSYLCVVTCHQSIVPYYRARARGLRIQDVHRPVLLQLCTACSQFVWPTKCPGSFHRRPCILF